MWHISLIIRERSWGVIRRRIYGTHHFSPQIHRSRPTTTSARPANNGAFSQASGTPTPHILHPRPAHPYPNSPRPRRPPHLLGLGLPRSIPGINLPRYQNNNNPDLLDIVRLLALRFEIKPTGRSSLPREHPHSTHLREHMCVRIRQRRRGCP